MIVAVKFLHIAALSLWCAGLLALPLLLALHAPGGGQQNFARLRLVTHGGYTRIVTPAAVIAIAAGTALIFLRGTWTPWFFTKLVLVGILALFHAWIGHVTLAMGEGDGDVPSPRAWPVVAGVSTVVVAILVVVLAKPGISADLIPDWLEQPRNQSLPVEEVPI